MLQEPDTWAFYAALGGVAAITTGLQAAVALQPLAAANALRLAKRSVAPGTTGYTTVIRDARRARRAAILLNIPAVLVNATVLVAWSQPAVSEPSPGDWAVWLPWVAVAFAALYLLTCAVVGIVSLHGITK